MAAFQLQPKELRLFLRPTALSIAYVDLLQCTISNLPDTKITASSGGNEK